MGHFSSKGRIYITLDAEPTTVHPGDAVEWIAIKPALSRGDRSRLQNSTLAASYDTESNKASLDFKTLDFELLLLQLAVVDWRLLEDGQPVPFSEAAIADLSSDDPLVDKALLEIVRRNPTRSILRGAPSG